MYNIILQNFTINSKFLPLRWASSLSIIISLSHNKYKSNRASFTLLPVDINKFMFYLYCKFKSAKNSYIQRLELLVLKRGRKGPFTEKTPHRIFFLNEDQKRNE